MTLLTRLHRTKPDPARGPLYQPELRTQARRLYDSGLSLSEVGVRMNRSPSRVRQLVREGGGTMRAPTKGKR